MKAYQIAKRQQAKARAAIARNMAGVTMYKTGAYGSIPILLEPRIDFYVNRRGQLVTLTDLRGLRVSISYPYRPQKAPRGAKVQIYSATARGGAPLSTEFIL